MNTILIEKISNAYLVQTDYPRSKKENQHSFKTWAEVVEFLDGLNRK